MKNYKILIVALLFSCFAYSQKFDKGIVTGPMTTTEINAIANPQEARLIYNSTTKTIWTYNGTIWVDSGSGGGSEVNDLSSVVTWANVPDANVPQSAVTQHQGALSITESQIPDLTHFNGDYNSLSNLPNLSAYLLTANLVAEVNTAFPNLDTDNTNDVTLNDAQTINSVKTFAGRNIFDQVQEFNYALVLNQLQNGYSNALVFEPNTANNFNIVINASQNEIFFNDEALAWRIGNYGINRGVRLDGSGNTAVRTYTLPDASGTVALDTDIPSDGTNLGYTNNSQTTVEGALDDLYLGTVKLTGNQSISGTKTFTGTFFADGNASFGNSFFIRNMLSPEADAYEVRYDDTTDELQIYFRPDSSSPSILIASIPSNGTPSLDTDLVDVEFLNTAIAGGVNSDASNIGVNPVGNLTSNNAQDAFAELQGDIDNIGLSGKEIESDATGLTNAGEVSNIVTATRADAASYASDPNRVVFITDPIPVDEEGSGTAIPMDGYYQGNTGSANSNTSYTLTDITSGGYAEILVNAASEPTITGATKLPNTASFITSTDMVMVVKAFGATVKYFFVEY